MMKDFRKPKYDLDNYTVLITGASSGIGRACAVACSVAGATILATGRDQSRLNQTLQMLPAGRHEAFVADLLTEQDIDELITKLPLLSGLVLSAGINTRQLCQYSKADDIQQILQTNLVAPIRLIRGLLRAGKVSRDASIVFISSISVHHSSIGNSVYSASKGGISSFSKVLALELASKGIRVNSVLPGMIRTPFSAQSPLTDEDYRKDEQRYPLGRYGEPEDVAAAVVFLLSDASQWITGIDLIVDGGVSLL